MRLLQRGILLGLGMLLSGGTGWTEEPPGETDAGINQEKAPLLQRWDSQPVDWSQGPIDIEAFDAILLPGGSAPDTPHFNEIEIDEEY